MISEQGAILIATVYPLALLVITVEARREFRTLMRDAGRVVRGIAAVFLLLTVGLTVNAVVLCVQHVSAEVTLKDGAAILVGLPGVMLAALSIIAFVALFISFFTDVE